MSIWQERLRWRRVRRQTMSALKHSWVDQHELLIPNNLTMTLFQTCPNSVAINDYDIAGGDWTLMPAGGSLVEQDATLFFLSGRTHMADRETKSTLGHRLTRCSLSHLLASM